MNPDPNIDEADEMTWIERHQRVLSVGVVLAIGAGVFLLHSQLSNPAAAQRKRQEIVSVRLPAPLPTPPPPVSTPLPEMQPQEKMIEQAPVDDKEVKPDDKPPQADPVSTNITGNGPDAFGLQRGNGSGVAFGGGGGQGSRFGWYAVQVQGTVNEALRKTPLSRQAAFNLKVRIWPDITGRVTRAKLNGTTHDAKLDEAIREALTGLQLREPPPPGMPAPIVMRLSASPSTPL